MHLIRSLIICSLLISLSIYAPYKAFFDHVPQNKNLVINIERGDTIYEVFSLFLPIPTIISSNNCLLLFKISKCPKVNGSNVPGKMALFTSTNLII